MSPIGSPDFGQNPSTNPTAPSFDTGEDTTRVLMGGGSFARSGRWLYADGFESGSIAPYDWSLLSTDLPITEAIQVETLSAWQGVNSLKINVGKNLNDRTTFSKYILLPSSRYGFEFMLARYEGDPYRNCELYIKIEGYGKGESKNKIRSGSIVFVKTGAPGSANWSIYYEKTGSPRVLIADVTNQMYALGYKTYHYIKFVFDFSTNKAVRLYFDDNYYELNADGYEAAFSGTAKNIFSISAYNKDTAGTNRQSWLIDNLIITADEP